MAYCILGIIFLLIGILTNITLYVIPWSVIFGMTAWWSIQYYFIIPSAIGVILICVGVCLLTSKGAKKG